MLMVYYRQRARPPSDTYDNVILLYGPILGLSNNLLSTEDSNYPTRQFNYYCTIHDVLTLITTVLSTEDSDRYANNQNHYQTAINRP